MRRRVRDLTIAAACGSVVLLAACSGGSGDGTTGSSPPATPSPSVTEFASIPGAEAFPAGEPVDLVVLRDSADAGVADSYATLAGEALDREVRVHDHFVGGLSEMPGAVQSWSDEVAQAEIILVYGNTAGLDPPQTIDVCVEASGWEEEADATPGLQGEPPLIASAEDWQPARNVLDEVFSAIWAARQGQPTIIRTHDFYNPFLAPWTKLGIERECIADWEALSAALRQAAEANGVGFVSLLDALNGTAHDQDPRAKGWVSEDGAHPSEEGAAVIAEALASVGFDASQPTTS